MKSTERYKKLILLSDPDLHKEIFAMQLLLMNHRIDIANRKTKGIKKIAEIRSDIARAKTIINSRSKENNEKG